MDVEATGRGVVTGHGLYQLIRQNGPVIDRTFEIRFLDPGVQAYAIVTKTEPGHSFYPAEAYHQDFMVRNPADRCIVVHDLPKLENLKRLFPDVYRARPV